MPPELVITGITSFRNRGVEALVSCCVAELRQRLPGARFTVLDRAPDFDAARLPAEDVKFRLDGTLHRLTGSAKRRIAAVLPLMDRVASRARRSIAGATAVIASGGDVFCSEYGHRSLLGHLEPLRLAARWKVPFFLHAHSIGPFTDEADRRVFMKIAEQARAISVREGASFNYLTETLGLSAGKVTHAADPAFLLPADHSAGGNRMFASLRGREDRPTVALSVSQAISHWMGGDPARHLAVWLEVVSWLREELDANVILIPHVQEHYDGNNDLLAATALLRHCGWDPRVRLAGGDLSAGDFKAIVSRCDFVVAERMHTAIAGLSSGVPVLAVGYSVKAEGILTDLFGPETTRRRALISYHDFLAPGAAVLRLREAWHSREALAAALAASLPAARARASGAFDTLSKLISCV